MRKKLVTVTAVLAVTFSVLTAVFAGNQTIFTESQYNTETENNTVVHFTPAVTKAQAETSLTKAIIDTETSEYFEDNQSVDKISTDTRLLTLLNMNYCYGEAFSDTEKLAGAIAISLNEYSADLPAYGICVSEALISGFSKDFYGIDIDFEKIDSAIAPEGYFLSPCFDYGSQYHKIETLIETDNGYDVTSTVTFYYGGNDLEQYTATVSFENAPESPFLFRIVSAELN